MALVRLFYRYFRNMVHVQNLKHPVSILCSETIPLRLMLAPKANKHETL